MLDELIAWHTHHDGWVFVKGGPDTEVRAIKGYPYSYFRRGNESRNTHPHPTTIDGAAAALPEGWVWYNSVTLEFPKAIFKYNAYTLIGEHKRVTVPNTGDEIYDRYLLAKLAKEAEGGTNV
jgi:hypothetical protein